MDGAQAYLKPIPNLCVRVDLYVSTQSRRAWRLHGSLRVTFDEASSSDDLGGSSKNSSESLEDRSGKGFHVNSIWTWVSRP